MSEPSARVHVSPVDRHRLHNRSDWSPLYDVWVAGRGESHLNLGGLSGDPNYLLDAADACRLSHVFNAKEKEMKGVVFTEFQELVEEQFGLDMYDRLVGKCELSTDGAFTSVGTYNHSELLQLVVALSEESNVPVSDLVFAFGKHLFAKFTAAAPHLLKRIDSAVSMLSNVEGFIHVEVRKLYPDAELPSFQFEEVSENKNILTYQSSRPFADLAHGLVVAAVEHFGDPIDVEREDLPGVPGTNARFVLTSRAEVPCSQ